jgi:hypothetical protein
MTRTISITAFAIAMIVLIADRSYPQDEAVEIPAPNAQQHSRKVVIYPSNGNIVNEIVPLNNVRFGVPQVITLRIENRSDKKIRFIEQFYNVPGHKVTLPKNEVEPNDFDTMVLELPAMLPHTKNQNIGFSIRCEGVTQRLDVLLMTQFIDVVAFAVDRVDASLPVNQHADATKPFVLRVPLVLSDPSLADKLEIQATGESVFDSRKIVREGNDVFAELTLSEALVPPNGATGELILQSPRNPGVAQHIPYNIARVQPIDVAPIEIVMGRKDNQHFSGKAFVRENSDYFNVATSATAKELTSWKRPDIQVKASAQNLNGLTVRTQHVNKGIHRLWIDIDLPEGRSIDKHQEITLDIHSESSHASVPIKIIFPD